VVVGLAWLWSLRGAAPAPRITGRASATSPLAKGVGA